MKKILLCLLASFILGASTTLVQAQQKIDREGFSVKYPDSWGIDLEDEDYDPDALFSLDSYKAEGASIMFMIYDGPMDADEMLAAQVKGMTKELIKNPTSITSFNTWGKLQGKGKKINGKMLGEFEGYVRLFIYTDNNKSMIILEQAYDSDTKTVGKDFISIANSFVFKK